MFLAVSTVIKKDQPFGQTSVFCTTSLSHTLLVMQSFAPTPIVLGHLPALASYDIFI
jgi:hypothetical protein